MPITVNLPNGAKAVFPDGTPKAAMQAAIQKKFPPKAAAAPDPASTPAEPQSIGDQLSAGFTSGVNAIPIAGPSILNGLEHLKGMVQGRSAEDVHASDAAQVDQNPVASTVGTVAGNVLPFMAGGAIPGVAKGLGMAGNLAERIGFGALSGAGINSADTAIRGGSLGDAESAALTGGALGAAFPIALRGLSGLKNSAAAALRGGAAETDAGASKLMKTSASQMFEKSKASGVQIAPESYQRFVQNTAQKVIDSGLDKTLHPDTVAVLENMASRAGKPMSFSDIHIIRQIAQDASRGQVPRDATKAGGIVDSIDTYIKGLRQGDVAANGGNVNDAVNGLVSGISQWAKASKTSTIEEALYRAANSASGLENGIRNEFRTLLRNPATRKVFTSEEQKLIESVVRGSVTSNLMKLAGKFGFGRGAATNMLGGSVGFGAGSVFGGPIGGILTALAASGARRGSEALTERGAQSVLHAVSGGVADAPATLPKVIAGTARRINSTPVNVPIGPAALPQLMQKKPIQITVDGGRR